MAEFETPDGLNSPSPPPIPLPLKEKKEDGNGKQREEEVKEAETALSMGSPGQIDKSPPSTYLIQSIAFDFASSEFLFSVPQNLKNLEGFLDKGQLLFYMATELSHIDVPLCSRCIKVVTDELKERIESYNADIKVRPITGKNRFFNPH